MRLRLLNAQILQRFTSLRYKILDSDQLSRNGHPATFSTASSVYALGLSRKASHLLLLYYRRDGTSVHLLRPTN